MKPAPFDYVAPDSLAGALALLGEHGDDAKLLAGGQSLVPLLNFRLAKPSLLIDLNRLSDLDFVRRSDDGGLRIGALTRQRRLERDPLVAECAPLLHETVPFIAHPQIRNRGTVGGSLVHADPAAELPVAAVALEARFRLQRTDGERWVTAEDFFVGLLTTDLAPEEMLVEVEIPPSPARTGWCFMEIARRLGDYAQAGVAAAITLEEDGSCSRARLVYLSAGDVPVLASAAARILETEGLGEESIRAAADTVADTEVEPTDDIHATAAFKRHLFNVLTRRAVATAAERAGNGGQA
jgi:carbon-monoxide dehydrogenase medium subunit